MPLFFGLADAVLSVGSRHSHVDASDPPTNVVHTLASKVLHTPLFTKMEWLSSGNQIAKVFHLVGRILEGKTHPTSLTVAQATVDPTTMDDLEEAARHRTRLAAESIAYFDAHTSDSHKPTTTYVSPASVSAVYLPDVSS